MPRGGQLHRRAGRAGVEQHADLVAVEGGGADDVLRALVHPKHQPFGADVIVLRPVRQLMVAAPGGCEEPHHAVAEVVLDVELSQHVLADQTVCRQTMFADQEFDVVERHADQRELLGGGPAHIRLAGESLDVNPRRPRAAVQTEPGGGRGAERAHERAGVDEQPHVLAIDLRADHRAQTHHGHRQVGYLSELTDGGERG